MGSVHEPDFSDAQDKEWNAPNLEDFDTDDLSEVDDHFVGSTTSFPPETYGELTLPVVEPDGTLNLNALQNAKARLGQVQGLSSDEKDRAETIINRLANEEFDADFQDTRSESVPAKVNEEIEYRKFEGEIRQANDGNILGMAVPFNEVADIGKFKEVIRPGAFQKTIQERDQRALFNHDKNFPLGRVSSNTLSLEERQDGLHYEINPPEWAENKIMESIERGDVRESSIGMKVQRQNFTEIQGEGEVREVLEAEIRDVGPVTFPAYPTSTSEVRSTEKKIQQAEMKCGMDIMELADLILRSERGEIQTRQDQKLLENWIERLKSMDFSDRITARKLDVARKELELEREGI